MTNRIERTSGPAHAPAVLTVDLDNLAWNWRYLRDLAAPSIPAAVVKANGYGLGTEYVVKTLAYAGCRLFFTAQLDEAVAVRNALPDPEVEIGVLNGLISGQEQIYTDHNLLPVLNDLNQIALWQKYSPPNQAAKVALQIDTGMTRLGLPSSEIRTLIEEPSRLEGLSVQYLMSHMACADTPHHPLNRQQLELFTEYAGKVPHEKAMLAASSTIFLGSDWHFDMVRPGIALYGGRPNEDIENPMKPVIRLDAKILQIQDVDAPQTVGYGASHSIGEPTRVATIGVGYADGYIRSLSGKATAVLNGVTIPLIGRVSMDLLTFDVSKVPGAAVGDQVQLIGPDCTIDDLADRAGTIGYEILTGLGNRYKRRYLGGPS